MWELVAEVCGLDRCCGIRLLLDVGRNVLIVVTFGFIVAGL